MKPIPANPQATLVKFNRLHNLNTQQGVALIVVLMILILITLVGVAAMRYGRVNLGVATSTQADKLLQQSSDVPLAQLRTSTYATDLILPEGPLGYLKIPDNEFKEYVFCYQPTTLTKLFSVASGNNMRIITTGGGVEGNGSKLYCNPNTDESYTSKRKVVMTQVSITRPGMSSGFDVAPVKPFDAANKGSAGIGKADPVYYRAYSTSVLPKMATTSSNAVIETCMQKPIGGLAEPTTSANMLNCLQAVDVPINSQVQDFIYVGKVEPTP